MFEFKIPLSIKIGPGVNTFGLALDFYINIEVKETVKSDDFSFQCDISDYPCDRKTIMPLIEKVGKYLRKENNGIKESISLKLSCDNDIHEFMNADASVISGLLISFFRCFHRETDYDVILRTFKKLSPDVECASACILGNIGLVDRDRKSFISLQWPSEWDIGIIKCCEDKVCKMEKIGSKDGYFSDSVSKSAVFVSALYSNSSELMFSSFQDNISYAMNRGGIPFIEKINLIGRTSKVAGLGFLKNDCGIIVTGGKENISLCINRIHELYTRNNIFFSTFFLKSSGSGVQF